VRQARFARPLAAAAVVSLAVALAGCGADEEDETQTVTEETVTTATAAPPTSTSPAATNAGPATTGEPGDDSPVSKRSSCGASERPDVKGLNSLSRRGALDCMGAGRVVRDYLSECAGTDFCTTGGGFDCSTERFAGDASNVECRRGRTEVDFGFGTPGA
jgi:hypothetical protein